jgi:hypothetical protein
MATWFASPTGNDGNSGLSDTLPKTYTGCEAAASAGDTINFMAGTYNIASEIFINKSGTAGNLITWKGAYNGEAILNYTGTVGSGNLIQCPTGSPGNYRKFDSLTLEGNNAAINGVKVAASVHHVTVNNCKIRNLGQSAIGCVGADYITATNNRISHCGYQSAYSFSSAISLQNSANTALFDAGTDFHHIVAYNIVSGEVDVSTNHTDGNGIILDQHSPNALIIGNIVYNCGGSGIRVLTCDSTKAPQGIYVVNNTTYKNVLDKQLISWPAFGEYCLNNSSAQVNFINNLAYAWTSTYTYQFLGTNRNSATGVIFARNYAFGGAGLDGIPAAISGDTSQVATIDPSYTSPPSIDPTADSQYSTCISSESIGNAFMIADTSKARNTGVDPSTIGSLSGPQATTLNTYKVLDVVGVTRPR